MNERNWKDTVLLPTTDFPMRAGLATREPEALKKWEEANLYQRLVEARPADKRWVFHDGPPYANGNIHHGHALNKILKDFAVKYHLLAGYRATNTPGWDCHGLPIEQKVDEELGGKKRELDITEFRKACRAYADRWIDVQREQFKRLMVLADWENPYRTMDYGYEATIVRELGKFMKEGYVFRGRKPVHWSWAAVTALADAEVEYAAYDAPSVYVKFPFNAAPEWLASKAGGRQVQVVIWTTTPWTLPSNLAIALNPELEYQLLALGEGEAIVVAEGLKASVFKACGLDDLEVLTSFKGEQLVGTGVDDCPRHAARHPFIDRDSVLLPADYVTLDQGTGCVHTAPGHGTDDFMLGQRFDIGLLAPVNDYGKFTDEVPEYAGMHVFKANPLIQQRLFDSGHLLNKPTDVYRVDRYPHCWRTKKPLIFRATAQWFIGIDRNDLRQRCLSAIGETQWVPSWGENRIRGMMEVRPDWCISRQRAWGVPITAFQCQSCGGEVVDHRIADHFAKLVEEQGADIWFSLPTEALVPEGYTCPHCNAPPSELERVKDILDVWFDSGVSWAAVMRDRFGLDGVADLYLEGSDQHRGWFHTSLIASVANAGRAPYRTVLTHGFVVDDKGHKYSKSSPNFEPLDRVIEQHGAEVLRLWVAAVDYRNDIVLAPTVIKQVSDVYRKVRNTVRFLLGNLDGFDPNAHAYDPSKLTPIDRWAVRQLNDFIATAQKGFESYEFHSVFHALNDFCNVRLSAVYLDVLKDRMYCAHPTDEQRLASQRVMWEIARALITICWPVLTFTMEEAWEMFPKAEGDPEFAGLLSLPSPLAGADVDAKDFDEWLDLREVVQAEIEARRPKKKGERVEGQLGSSQEAVVTLQVPEARAERLQNAVGNLEELFIVSQVKIVGHAGEGVKVGVDAATGERCPRCWNWRADIAKDQRYEELCGRCADVIARG